MHKNLNKIKKLKINNTKIQNTPLADAISCLDLSAHYFICICIIVRFHGIGM